MECNRRETYTTNYYATSVAVAGNYAYLSYPCCGLIVIDISNPANPRRVGGTERFNALGVTIAGDKVFVAAGDSLVILNTVTPPLRFEPLARFDAGVFRFSLSGPAGQSARVQRSDNLRDWLDWQTVTVGNSPIEVADPDVSVQRFYRAVTP